jgi:hypothetical protein
VICLSEWAARDNGHPKNSRRFGHTYQGKKKEKEKDMEMRTKVLISCRSIGLTQGSAGDGVLGSYKSGK